MGSRGDQHFPGGPCTGSGGREWYSLWLKSSFSQGASRCCFRNMGFVLFFLHRISYIYPCMYILWLFKSSCFLHEINLYFQGKLAIITQKERPRSLGIKVKLSGPGCVAQVVGAPSCTPKTRRFHSQLGHIPAIFATYNAHPHFCAYYTHYYTHGM